MRLQRPRLNHFLLLACALVLLSMGAAFSSWFESLQHNARNARETYLSALTSTRVQLASLVGSLAVDNVLTQNVDWGLNNSVGQALAGRLRKGELDQLHLFDGSCVQLARASIAGFSAAPCPITANKAPPASAFYWTRHEGSAALGLTLTLKHAHGMPIYLTGLVHLDADWRRAWPAFDAAAHKLGLEIVDHTSSRGRMTLLSEGKGSDGQSTAILATRDPLIRLVERALFTGIDLRSILFWPFVALAAFAAFSAWSQTALHSRRFARSAGEFLTWCRSLNPLTGGTTDTNSNHPPRTAHQIIDNPQTIFDEAQRNLGCALQAKIDTNRALTEKRSSLEATISRLNRELSAQESRLAALVQLDTLSLQMQRTTTMYLNKIDQVRGLAEDVLHTLRHDLSAAGDPLFSFVQKWQKGIRERGGRKFLRTLAEAPGCIPDHSQLDDELSRLHGLSTTIAKRTIEAAVKTRRLVDELANIARIAGLWQQMALTADEEDDIPTLGEALAEAQQILQLDPAFGACNIVFRNLLDANDSAFASPAPRGTMISALYHIFLALAENPAETPPSSTTLAVRLKRDGIKTMLVITTTAEGGRILRFDHAGRAGRAGQVNLQIAGHLLEPFGAQSTALPTISGPTPIAIIWRPDESLSVNEQSFDRQRTNRSDELLHGYSELADF